MKWEKRKIEEICSLVTSGGTPLTSMPSYYWPEEIPWLKTAEVNYCRIHDTESYISKEGLARSSAKLIPENSVIIAMYGQGDTAGRVAINKIPLATNQACCNLVINSNIADYEFVYYSLATLYQQLVAMKNGGAQPNLNAKKIKAIEIPVPPLDIQHSIASVLHQYDNLIENSQKQIKLLEEAAQRLYQEWFVKLRFPGHEKVKVVDGVPEGWRHIRVSDLGDIVTGKTPPTSNADLYGGDIPFVKIPDMHGVVFPIKTEATLSQKGADTQKGKYIPANSIIVSCIATVGLVNITTELCQTNQQINAIVPSTETDLYYIYFTMKRLKNLLDGVGSNGATMTNVNKTKFGKLEILYPDRESMKKYFEICKPFFDRIMSFSMQNEFLAEARDRLLPKLMSGEIEV